MLLGDTLQRGNNPSLYIGEAFPSWEAGAAGIPLDHSPQAGSRQLMQPLACPIAEVNFTQVIRNNDIQPVMVLGDRLSGFDRAFQRT